MFIHINTRLTSPYFNSITIENIKSYFNHSDLFDHFDFKFIIRITNGASNRQFPLKLTSHELAISVLLFTEDETVSLESSRNKENKINIDCDIHIYSYKS